MGPPNIRIKFKHFEATLYYYEVIYFNNSHDLKLFMSTLNSHSFYFKDLKTLLFYNKVITFIPKLFNKTCIGSLKFLCACIFLLTLL